jgi:hypothetical protein
MVVVGQSRGRRPHQQCQGCQSRLYPARGTVPSFEYDLIFHNLLQFPSVLFAQAQWPVVFGFQWADLIARPETRRDFAKKAANCFKKNAREASWPHFREEINGRGP